MMSAKSELPSGYTRCEYIEANRTQYIDTGIKQAKFVHDIEFFNTGTRDLMGNSASGGQYWGANATRIQYDFSGATIPLNPNERRTVTYNNINSRAITLTVGDITHTTSRTYASIPTNYCLLAIKNSEYYCYAKLYSFKAYDESDNLIADYVPALDPSGRPCMYDTVTKRPFYSDGTGDFLYRLA